MIDISNLEAKEEGLFLIYGKPGTGKTSIAKELAKDGLTAVITFDRSHSVLKPEIEAGTIKVFMMDYWNDFKEKNYQDTIDALLRDLQPFKYVVFDNISSLEQILISKRKETLGTNNKLQAFGLFQDEMYALAELCVELPAVCFVTAWEKTGDSEYGPIPMPDLNTKVLGSFGGLGQGVFHMTQVNNVYAINTNKLDTSVYIKNRKNNVPTISTSNLVKFIGLTELA